MCTLLLASSTRWCAVSCSLDDTILSSLLQIFNDEVDAYQPWTLFLIFVSMIILISGVILLTYKKPEKKVPSAAAPGNVAMASRPAGRPRRKNDDEDGDEEDALRTGEEPDPEEVWQIGSTNESDDEGGVVPHTPRPTRHRSASARSREGEEERMIVDEDEEGRASTSSDATLTRPESSPPYADDEFGTWEQGKLRR